MARNKPPASVVRDEDKAALLKWWASDNGLPGIRRNPDERRLALALWLTTVDDDAVFAFPAHEAIVHLVTDEYLKLVESTS